MSASTQRAVYYVAALIIITLLTSCTTRQPAIYSKYTGTDGLVVEFPLGAPPDQVYESKPFPVKLTVANLGATDVSYEKLLITFNTDPLYVSNGITFYDFHDEPDQGVFNPNDAILGRSDIYPRGEKRLYGVPTTRSFVAKPVYGQREQPSTDIVANVCYAYTTYAAVPVCIDTTIYQDNERQQSCKQADVTLTGGQGAPIAVTSVEVRALPIVTGEGESIRPQFIIHVQNVGKGILVGPESLATTRDGLEAACVLRQIPKEQAGAVRIDASLLRTKLQCGLGTTAANNGIVRLIDGSGEIVCVVPENAANDPIYRSTQNFQSMLLVNLTYLYKTSASKTIEIERILGNEPQAPVTGPVTGYLYENDQLARDAEGKAIKLCNYYSLNPLDAPELIRTTMEASFPKRFSCSCNQDQFIKLGRTGHAIAGLCPGNTYCCTEASVITGGVAPDGINLAISDITIQAIGPAPTKQQISDALVAAEKKYGIPTDLLKAIAYQESRWNPAAIGDSGRSRGMMQIHTKYHPEYDVSKGSAEASYQIEYAAKFLTELHKQENDWYNAVRRYNGAKKNPATATYANSVFSHQQKRPWVTAFKVQ